MEKAWLTEELDNTPYFYDNEKLTHILTAITIKKSKIDTYLNEHPKLKEQLFSSERRKYRFRKSALSYLTIDTNDIFDIVPTKFKTAEEKEHEQDQIQQLLAYEEACQLSHEFAINPSSYLSDRIFVRLHTQLCQGDIDKRNKMRSRLRNENDPVIMIGQGYFNPISGDKVAQRVSMLLYHYENTWNNDNIFAKGAKFVTEYVRIQPHLDGNKRVALMLLNYILEKHGYSNIYFDKEQIDELYNSIKISMISRDVTSLAELIAKSLDLFYDSLIEKIKDYRISHFEFEQKLID